jgi:hypothetical protein
MFTKVRLIIMSMALASPLLIAQVAEAMPKVRY